MSRTSSVMVRVIRGMPPEEWFAGIAKSKYPDFLAPVPLGELLTIEDVAQMVLFFTVPESRHLTGPSGRGR